MLSIDKAGRKADCRVTMQTFVIVNPRSGGGRTGRLAVRAIAQLRAGIGPCDVAFTTRPLEATTLARAALDRGYTRIVAMGGDGTTNEVVNGFFRDGTAISATASLGIVSSGTGGDFCRTVGIAAGIAAGIARLREVPARPVDVGHVRYVDAQGMPRERYFLNVASFGLSADVVERVAQAGPARVLGGRFTYLAGALGALLRHRQVTVRVTIDSHYDISANMTIGAICNGRYFGGGLMVAPNALPDDGLFDVVLLRGSTRLGVVARMSELLRGAHLAHRTVNVERGESVKLTGTNALDKPIRLEIDGETGAYLPAHLTLRRHALLVHM